MSDGDKTQGEGIIDQVKGKAEQAIGGITGDRKQQAEGMGDEGKGNVKQGLGDLQNKVTGNDN